ncbi:MAG: HAD-IC family P-type ATPase [Candidatus Kapabacteria bacterium]|nr:HAD-IC family P-type ATPase [Candidatus Kapabacteria bacterium]
MGSQTHKDVCYHCGAECRSGSVQADAHSFCCHGCAGVYELLRAHDSCTYYDVEAHPGQRPESDHASRYDGLDLSGAFVSSGGAVGRSILQVQIPDMHCASCVWLLERLTRFDEGIVSSRVDLMSRTLTVDFRTDRTTASRIAMLLTSLGYPPVTQAEANDGKAVKSGRRKLYTQLGVAGFASGNVMMIGLAKYVAGPGGMSPDVELTLRSIEVILSIPVLLYCAQPWLRSAWGSLRRGVVNLDVPVSIGVLTLFFRSFVDIFITRGDGFLDSFTGLVFLLLIGRLFQQRAFQALEFDRSMRSFFPLSATRIHRGTRHDVAIEDLAVGDLIFVRNGEVIAADAILLQSSAVVDYAYLTGESEPVECAPGAMLYAGGRILGRSVQLSVVKPSTTSYMASLWSRQDTHTQRTKLAWTSERFGLIFTIGALGIALAAGIAWLPNIEMALTVFSSVLIIACPCALTLAMPITYGTAMTMLAGKGIFLKNVAAISELQSVGHVVFDKTGTLTSPDKVEYVGEPLAPWQRMAFASMARHSTHPVSQAIARQEESFEALMIDVEEISGKGLVCTIGDVQLALGSVGLATVPMTDVSPDVNRSGSLAIIDGRAVGRYLMRHTMRPGVEQMVRRLMRRSTNVSVISGDSPASGAVLSRLFRPEQVQLSATPEEKVQRIHEVQKAGVRVLMVGDGLNDIAAMSAANVSVAVSNGSSRIVPACDVMIDAGRVPVIDRILEYATAQRIVVQIAFWFTMAYNVLGITLAASGQLSPVITAIMMPASSLLVIAISVGGARWTFRRMPWE